ncbi:MAG TPA: hypothetical protein VF033_00575, partial [Steroidobacteraceae bacterium]
MKKTLMAVAWLCCAPTHADISVDDGYGEAGIAAAPLIAGFDQQVVDVAIDAQGRAVVVGQTYVPPAGFFTWQLAVARFNADGTPDNTFSGDGRLHMAACMPLTGADSDATAVLIQPDGKILVAGTCHSAPSRAVLLRFLADGSLDEDFGEGGVAIFSGEPGTGGINAYAIGLQSDGRIVLAGQIGVNTFPPRALVMRANVDGTLDTTFASGGYHVAAMNDSWYLALEVMDDDRIVVAGHANARSGFPADYNFLVARLEAGGAPDGTFNGNGFIDLDVPPMPTVPTLPASSQEFVNGLAIRPDGRIVIAGSASGNGSSNR